MENEERDLVIVEDENGGEMTLEIVDRFLYDGEEYAVLVEEGADVEAEDVDAFIMKVETEGEDEIFSPVDTDRFDEVAEAYMNMDEEDEEEL